ncbi:MAG: 1-phosphofructokinase [Lachnospiraceae bacterium]|nr:1-phosphofructokinase [Lachnospiraceae bacterium]
MIYTVTLNPAIDYAIGVEKLEPGMTNRATFEQLLPGGKGLNVSIILGNLGIDNIALGFIAGFTGKEIRRRFEAFGGKSDFIELKKGISRINVKIKSSIETEINAAGPAIDTEALSLLMGKLDMLKDKDILILAGSLPSSLPDTLYSDIMKMLADRNIMIVVDATKELLLNVLPHRPFLVKPNSHELGEIFGVTITTREEVVQYARKLQEKGAGNVLVSMAGDGAVLVTQEGDILMREAPKGIVKNSVGAGDSMVAGFVAGWCARRDYGYAFKMGLASGSASAFSELPATRQEIEAVYQSL